MRRKVNKVGQNTLTVSLPNTWIKKHNINKGDELEVEEKDSQLIFSREFQPTSKQTTLDVSNQGRMIQRLIGAVYKAGYDDVIIKYSTAEELKIIQERTERVHGEFAIVEYKTGQVHIKSIAHFDPAEFNTVFRKIFFVLQDMANDTLKALKENNYEELKSLAMRDVLVDKYTDYCRRAMNKGYNPKFKKNHAIYYLVEETEIIADLYKDLCQYTADNQIKTSKLMTDFLNDVNKFITEFIDIIFNYSLDKIKTLGHNREKINKQIDKLCNEINKKDIKTFLIITHIYDNIFEMKSAILTENV